MKYVKAMALLLTLGTPMMVQAHGGGLDRYGCHHNRKQGGYHCHRGELAGQHFQSKEEMLKVLRGKTEDVKGPTKER